MTTKRIRNALNANGAIEILDDGTVQFSDKTTAAKTTVSSITQSVQDAGAGKPSYFYNSTGTNLIQTPTNSALALGNSDATFLFTAKLNQSAGAEEYIRLYVDGGNFLILDKAADNTIRFRDPSGVVASTDLVNNGLVQSLAGVLLGNTMSIYKNSAVLVNALAHTKQTIVGIPYAKIGDTTSSIVSGNVYRALIFNYALPVDKIARYSAGAKLDFEDIGGSMAEIAANGTLEGTYVSGVSPSWTKASASDTFAAETVNMYSGSSCQKITWVAGTDSSIYQSIAAPAAGKRIRFSAMVRSNRAGTIFTFQVGPTKLTYTIVAANAWEKASVELISIGTTNFEVGVQSGQTAGDVYLIDNVSVIQLGAILDLEPESMTPSVWHDESGNVLDGVVTGAQLVNTPHFSYTDYGMAAVKQELIDSLTNAASYNFSVDGNLIVTPSIALGTNDITMLAIVKHSTVASASGQYYAGAGAAGAGLQFALNSSQKIFLYTGSTVNTASNTTLVANKVYAIAALAGTTTAIYINGILDKTDSGANSMGTSPLYVGALSGGTTRSFLGQMYKFITFNYCLSEDKIRRYSAGAKLDFEDIGGSTNLLAVSPTMTGFESQGTIDSTQWNGVNSSGTAVAFYPVSSTRALLIGNKYRLYYTASIPSGITVTVSLTEITDTGGASASFALANGASYIDIPITIARASMGIEFTVTGTSATSIAVTGISIIQLGAILDLEPESMTPTVWHDESGNALDGAVTGAQLINTPQFAYTDYGPAAVKQELLDSSTGTSYRFDGLTSYVSIADTPHLSFGTSVAGVVAPDSPFSIVSIVSLSKLGAYQYLIGKTNTSKNEWSLYLNDTNNLLFAAFDYSSGALTKTSYAAVGTGKHAFASVYDGSKAGTGVNLYIDSLLVRGTAAGTITGLGDLTAAATVGAGEEGGNYRFGGQVFRTLVFNYALSEEKIRRYSAGARLDWEDIGGSMTNLAVNGGFNLAGGGTDWASPTAGLAQYWTSYTANGHSIVTGNGFTGNAQRAAYVSANGDTQLLAPGSATLGKRYRITLKYRSSKPLLISVGSYSTPLVTLATNTGNAIQASAEYVADATSGSTSVGIGFAASTTGDYFEIDEVQIIQLGAVLDLEPEGIYSDKWVDSSGNNLHGTNSNALVINATNKAGTWTPVNVSSDSVTFSINHAFYHKIGKMVFASAFITFPTTTGATQSVLIGGLPFKARPTGGSDSSSLNIAYTDYTTPITGLIAQNTKNFILFTYGGAAITNLNMSTRQLRFTAIYPTEEN